MSTWFTEKLQTFGMIALGLLVAFAVIEITIWFRKHPIAWKVPGKDLLGKGLGKAWDKHGMDTLKSLTLISILLFFVNVLFAQTGYEWWRVWRNENGLFWTAQFSLLFSFYTLMTKTGWIPKALATAVIGIIISGVIKVVMNPPPEGPSVVMTTLPEIPMPAPRNPVTKEIKAGQWEKFDVGMSFRIEMVGGIPFTCKVNDNPREFRSGPDGGHLDFGNLAPNTLIWRLWFKPDRDITITIR